MDLKTKLLTRRTVKAVALGTDGGNEIEAFVRVMTTNELLDVQAKVKDDDLSEIDAAAWLACKAICNQAGDRLFSDDDFPTLKTMDVGILVELANAAAELNTIGKKKAPASATTSGSSSASPPT